MSTDSPSACLAARSLNRATRKLLFGFTNLSNRSQYGANFFISALDRSQDTDNSRPSSPTQSKRKFSCLSSVIPARGPLKSSVQTSLNLASARGASVADQSIVGIGKPARDVAIVVCIILTTNTNVTVAPGTVFDSDTV